MDYCGNHNVKKGIIIIIIFFNVGNLNFPYQITVHWTKLIIQDMSVSVASLLTGLDELQQPHIELN